MREFLRTPCLRNRLDQREQVVSWLKNYKPESKLSEFLFKELAFPDQVQFHQSDRTGLVLHPENFDGSMTLNLNQHSSFHLSLNQSLADS